MSSDVPSSPDFEPSEWHKKEDSDRREIYNKISKSFHKIHISHNNFIEIETVYFYTPRYSSDGYCSYSEQKIFKRKTDIKIISPEKHIIPFFEKKQDNIVIYTIRFSTTEANYYTTYFSEIGDRDMAMMLFLAEL